MRKPLIIALVATLAAIGLTPLVPAQIVQGKGASLSAVKQTSWQTNGPVRAIAIAKGRVYVGGQFTRVRPPGAAPGTREAIRYNLAAFDQRTGALVTSFNHSFDKPVYSIAAYYTGSRIYVGGDFTRVDGQLRRGLAAFDTATGKLVPGWSATVNCCRVKALATYGNVVYLGGSFGAVSGQSRTRLAAVSAVNGTVLNWAPRPDKDVYAIDVADNGSKVYVGGDFTWVSGHLRRKIFSITPAGAMQSFPAESAIPVHCRSVVKDIDTYGSAVYVANGGDGAGCFDGTFAADVATGGLIWKNNCLGATEAISVVGGWLYKGSHAHDCSQDGGFPEGYGNRRLLVQNLSNGRLGPWYPNTDSGPPTQVGPLAMASYGFDLWVGGDFTKVFGAGQQGLTHFANAVPGLPPSPPAARPTVTSPAAGSAKVRFQTTLDLDNHALIYRLVRGSTVIKTWTATSYFWARGWLEHTETGLPRGSSVNYRVQVFDGYTNVWGPWSIPIRVQ